MYSIGCFVFMSNLSRFSNVYPQPFESSKSAVSIASFKLSFEYNPTLTLFGLFPSLLRLSSKCLVIFTDLYSFSTGFSVSLIGSQSCVAVKFLITFVNLFPSFFASLSFSLKGLIDTVNVILLLSPGSNATVIPFLKSSSV